MSNAGVVTKRNGEAINEEGEDQILPAVGVSEDNYLVAWSDERSEDSFDIYAALVTPAGTNLSGSGFEVEPAPK